MSDEKIVEVVAKKKGRAPAFPGSDAFKNFAKGDTFKVEESRLSPFWMTRTDGEPIPVKPRRAKAVPKGNDREALKAELLAELREELGLDKPSKKASVKKKAPAKKKAEDDEGESSD